MISDYIKGKLPVCIRGGYDFVDVRDVAGGCLAAAHKGKSGECYILSNRHYELKDIFSMIRSVNGGRRLPVLPLRIAEIAAPFFEKYADLKKHRPLYTRYSLYALSSNDRFSHDKATRFFGYCPRDIYETICDTVCWINGKTCGKNKAE